MSERLYDPTVPRAQEILSEGGHCRIFYRLPDGSGALCMEPVATCRHHSRVAVLRREALPVIEALRKYEYEHGDVRDGWVCLKVALAAAEAALEGTGQPEVLRILERQEGHR